MQESITIQLKDKTREVRMAYNVLLLCARIIQKKEEEGGTGGFSFDDQVLIFSYLLGEVDKEGNIITFFNLAELDSPAEGLKVLLFVQEQVADFFTKLGRGTENLMNRIEKQNKKDSKLPKQSPTGSKS